MKVEWLILFIKEWPIGKKEVTDLLLALAKSALRYAIAALCWLLFAWSTTLLVSWFDVPWIHALENFFCPLIQALYFRQDSHHSTETRLQSLGSLSHRNQVRLSWGALYWPCHLSKVLIVIWRLSLFSDWLELTIPDSRNFRQKLQVIAVLKSKYLYTKRKFLVSSVERSPLVIANSVDAEVTRVFNFFHINFFNWMKIKDCRY